MVETTERAVISNRLVTVFGGSGFVGRHAVHALCKQGFRVRVAVRRPELATHVLTAGAVGQVYTVQANLRYLDSVLRAADGAEAVINLVGLLSPKGRNTFEAAHVFGADAVAKAALKTGVQRLIHVSALGADEKSPSAYARTKAQGEAAVLSSTPGAVIIRPSIVFGPEDMFFNQFAALARLSPVIPILGGEKVRVQPVFVGDVAEALTKGAAGLAKPSTVYELGGPQVMTLRQAAQLVCAVLHRKRLYVTVPLGLAGLAAKILRFLPGSPLTPDQVYLLKQGSVVSQDALAGKRTLEGLGIAPHAAEAIVEAYLWRFRRAGQFERAIA